MALMRKNRGFSLIEVLVSVVVMSVGILGVTGLQMISLQQNRSSLLRAEATQLANDILDRMRANPTQNYAGVAFTDGPPSSSNCVASSCTPPNMKDFDVAQWKCSINSSSAGAQITACASLGVTGTLPEGEGAIVDDSDDSLCAVAADEVCVVVRWTDDADGTKSAVAVRTRVD